MFYEREQVNHLSFQINKIKLPNDNRKKPSSPDSSKSSTLSTLQPAGTRDYKDIGRQKSLFLEFQ